MVAANTTSLMSIGRAAELLQAHPCQIRAAIDAAEIAPAMELNDIGYYTEEDIDRIAHRLRERATTTRRPMEPAHRPANLLR